MKIAVCIKQVPNIDKILFNPADNTIVREGVESIINPYDAYALETALRFKEKYGGEVTAFSMGPKQAEVMLESCFEIGVDEAILLTDNVFKGSDTYATATVLTAALKKAESRDNNPFDLILFGKQTTDGETGQITSIVSQLLDRPDVHNIRTAECNNGGIKALRIWDGDYQEVLCELPAVLSVSSTPWNLRLPTLKSKLNKKNKAVIKWGQTDLKLSADACGVKGSPTRVLKTFVATNEKVCSFIDTQTDEGMATSFCEVLYGTQVEGTRKNDR